MNTKHCPYASCLLKCSSENAHKAKYAGMNSNPKPKQKQKSKNINYDALLALELKYATNPRNSILQIL